MNSKKIGGIILSLFFLVGCQMAGYESDFTKICSSDSDICGKPMTCEGTNVKLKGYTMPGIINITPKSFGLNHSLSVNGSEFWVTVSDGLDATLIAQLQKYNQEKLPIYISGKISGVDLPINGDCKRGISIAVKSSDILFK